MKVQYRPSWLVFFIVTIKEVIGADDDYNVIHRDGSYEFGYNNPDSYHYEDANRNNIVKGEFGARNPATGAIDSTVYTAGPRGFRPRGKNVVRKYDLNQNGPRPVGSRDDPYYDPYEDPSYDFSFATGRYNRKETANRLGDVSGTYSYTDDVGERHRVDFIAGKNTGFHVKTPFPDSNPRAYGPLYFNGRGKPIPRGRTSIQRGLDGSYRFVSAGPDQRRTETSDSTGHVRGSYTYLDDKGVQHSVHYIAGPETGYRVLKQVKGPHLPTVFPFGRPGIIPPDFYDYGKDTDVFDTAASGHVKPFGSKPGAAKDEPTSGQDQEEDKDEFTFGNRLPTTRRPISKPISPVRPRPSYEDEDQNTDDFGDLFGDSGATGGGGGGVSTTPKPLGPLSPGSFDTGVSSKEDDGSYKSSGDDGSYRPGQSNIKPTSSSGGSTTPAFSGRPQFDGSLGSGEVGRPSGASRPGGRPDVRPSGAPGGNAGYGTGYGGGRPTPSFSGGSNEINNDSGLFGSESSNTRPPYGRPVIQIGATDDSCRGCRGTLVTNVGDKLLTVPPGVSVRAHVQSIDLLPVIPTVPSPSEQYKAETRSKTEQLLESPNELVDTSKVESKSESITTETTTTTASSKTNSTSI